MLLDESSGLGDSHQKILQALTESPGNVKRFPAPAAQPQRTESHWSTQAEAAPLN